MIYLLFLKNIIISLLIFIGITAFKIEIDSQFKLKKSRTTSLLYYTLYNILKIKIYYKKRDEQA